MAGEKDIGDDMGQDDAGLALDEEDRLPWLEAAEDYDEDGEVSPTRLLAMVLGGLLLIGAVLGGLWWLQNGGARGQGELIAADKGDYKVQPTDNAARRSEEHTSELQSLMRISYAVFCLKKKKPTCNNIDPISQR